MRLWIGVVLALLVASPAAALSESDKASLAGEWRAACGADASGMRLVLEFALTGGTVFVDDGSESAATHPIAELEKRGELALAAGSLKWNGAALQRCRPAADRSAIRLSKQQIAEISSAMAPDHAISVDVRAKGGCKALDYQYLTIDLVGPLGFRLGRWNSAHLGEMLADGRKAPLSVDEVSNWTIDRAQAVPGGYRLTITELIPPNGSRGDTTTITLGTPKDGKAVVAEWKRSYLRCSENSLAAH